MVIAALSLVPVFYKVRNSRAKLQRHIAEKIG